MHEMHSTPKWHLIFTSCPPVLADYYLASYRDSRESRHPHPAAGHFVSRSLAVSTLSSVYPRRLLLIQYLSSPLSVSPTRIPSLGSFLRLQGRSDNLKLPARPEQTINWNRDDFR
jgi:hypothetical protein